MYIQNTSQISKWSFKLFIIFKEALHLICLTRFWIYLCKGTNTRTTSEVFSKLTIKTPNWFCSDVIVVNSEHISHNVLVSRFDLQQVNSGWVDFYLSSMNHYKWVLGGKSSKPERTLGATTCICKKMFFYAKSNLTQTVTNVFYKNRY